MMVSNDFARARVRRGFGMLALAVLVSLVASSLPVVVAGEMQMAERTQGAPSSESSATIADTNERFEGWITHVESPGIGRIAVHIQSPDTPRYASGAPIVVNVSGFFTASSGFDFQLDPDALGCVYVTYLWPGKSDARTGISSEGSFDYGGEDCLAALRDVIRFATGETADVDGHRLDEFCDVAVRYDVAGLYAFSHSGIAATNVLTFHGADIPGIRFFVGRENPTIDALYPLEPGYWDDATGRPIHNPFYDPAGYTPTSIAIDYSTVSWSEVLGRPIFRTQGGAPDYVCSTKHPQMWGKDYWSTDLLQALLDNGSLTSETWPSTLATPEEAAENWPLRTTADKYVRLLDQAPTLRVMLVFAAADHVQTALDKPHIHQAYDGFHEVAKLWCRLNPDRAYLEAFAGPGAADAFPDNRANTEPSTWAAIRSWGYVSTSKNLNVLAPLASVAEMLDRTAYDVWDADLGAVLHEY